MKWPEKQPQSSYEKASVEKESAEAVGLTDFIAGSIATLILLQCSAGLLGLIYGFAQSGSQKFIRDHDDADCRLESRASYVFATWAPGCVLGRWLAQPVGRAP